MSISSCSSPQLNLGLQEQQQLSMELAAAEAILALRSKLNNDAKQGLAPSQISHNKALIHSQEKKLFQFIDQMYGKQSGFNESLQLPLQGFSLSSSSQQSPFLPSNEGAEFGFYDHLPQNSGLLTSHFHNHQQSFLNQPNPIWGLLGNSMRHSEYLPQQLQLISLLNLQQRAAKNIESQKRMQIESHPSYFIPKIETIPILKNKSLDLKVEESDQKESYEEICVKHNSSLETSFRFVNQSKNPLPINLIINGEQRESSFSHQRYTNLTQILQNPSILNQFTDILALKQNNNPSQSEWSNETAIYRRMLSQSVMEGNLMKRYDSINDENRRSSQENILESIESMRQLGMPLSIRSNQSLMDSIAIEAPSKDYEVYKNLMKMCEQFIRGEKRKRFKQRNIDSQYMSRFHNLNRLFFYQIVSIYSYESISCFNLPSTIAAQLRHIISCVKIHSKLQPIKRNQAQKQSTQQDISTKRSFSEHSKDSNESNEPRLKKIQKLMKSEEKSVTEQSFEDFTNSESDDDDFPIRNVARNYQTLKVEAYTHSHYNVLFLSLNSNSMESLKHSKKDIEAHWLAYKIDLRKPSEISSEKLEYANLMKALFYKIFLHFNSVTESSVNQFRASRMEEVREEQRTSQPDIDLKAIELRLDYYIRVAIGIQKLSEGSYSHKF